MDQSLLQYGLLVIIGTPLLMLVLGELGERLEKEGRSLGGTLRSIRVYLLPAVALLLLVHMLSPYLPPTHGQVLMALASTVLGLAIIYVILFRRLALQVKTHTSKLFSQLFRALAFIAVIGYLLVYVWGVDLKDLSIALGVSTIALGLILQQTLSSLVSGALVILEKPIRRGDWVRLGQIEGEVIEINWRSMRLKNGGTVVVIPNVVLSKEAIYNYTLTSQQHKDTLTVSFSYDDSPNRIKQVLRDIALNTATVLVEPPPRVVTEGYRDTAITYQVTYFVKDFNDKGSIRDELMTRIYYGAKRHHLKIAGNSCWAAIPPAEITDFLSTLAYFARADRQDIHELAQQLTVEYYGIGEQVIRQGQLARRIYIIFEGELRLLVTEGDGAEKTLSVLTRGDFFGETALLPGQPSYLSGVVLEDLTVVAVEPAVLNQLLKKNPFLALEINQFVDKRKKAVDC